jgi:hypothetical protein
MQVMQTLTPALSRREREDRIPSLDDTGALIMPAGWRRFPLSLWERAGVRVLFLQLVPATSALKPFLACACLLFTAPLLFAASQLTVGTNAGFPDTTIPVSGQFTSDAGVVALQYDVLFDGAKLGATAIAGGNSLVNHNLLLSSLGNGTNRVVVYSYSNAQLTNGVLASLYFTIASNAPVGTTAITLTNGLLANAAAQAVAGASYVPGSLTIVAGPARLGMITRAVNGLIQFQVTGSYNASYVIEASTNLVQWTAVSTNVAVGGMIQLQDADSAVYPTRFYRARVGP